MKHALFVPRQNSARSAGGFFFLAVADQDDGLQREDRGEELAAEGVPELRRGDRQEGPQPRHRAEHPVEAEEDQQLDRSLEGSASQVSCRVDAWLLVRAVTLSPC